MVGDVAEVAVILDSDGSGWIGGGRLCASGGAHRELKWELGLDQFEGRSRWGWCHHVVLVMRGATRWCFERAANHLERMASLGELRAER